MLPRIDFYIIPEKTTQAIWLFICKLLEKAYHQKSRSFIYVEDEACAEKIHDLLWTFKEDSFIPHELFSQTNSAPIQIGHGNHYPANDFDILFNLTGSIPEFFTSFNRIIEVAPEEPAWKNNSRNKYREYKAQNFVINNHDLRK